MLGFEFDLLVKVDVGYTILSSMLAVGFTFLALTTDLLWDRHLERKVRPRQKSRRSSYGRKSHTMSQTPKNDSDNPSSAPLLQEIDTDEEDLDASPVAEMESVTLAYTSDPQTMSYAQSYRSPSVSSAGRSGPSKPPNGLVPPRISPDREEVHETSAAIPTGSRARTSSDCSLYGQTTSSSTSLGLSSAMELIYRRGSEPAKNAFIATANLLYVGCTPRNLGKGFIWSLAITSMHYSGILALEIPSGYIQFNAGLVLLSAIISWTVWSVVLHFYCPLIYANLLKHYRYSSHGANGDSPTTTNSVLCDRSCRCSSYALYRNECYAVLLYCTTI
jgi:hypothetical protein